jgi:hypothetical protein
MESTHLTPFHTCDSVKLNVCSERTYVQPHTSPGKNKGYAIAFHR